jgi:hypothetical protein
MTDNDTDRENARWWVARSQWGGHGTIHANSDCILLNQSPDVREADESEVDKYTPCKRCSGDCRSAHEGESYSTLSYTLENMDPD